jgi:hypothetical protein
MSKRVLLLRNSVLDEVIDNLFPLGLGDEDWNPISACIAPLISSTKKNPPSFKLRVIEWEKAKSTDLSFFNFDRKTNTAISISIANTTNTTESTYSAV